MQTVIIIKQIKMPILQKVQLIVVQLLKQIADLPQIEKLIVNSRSHWANRNVKKVNSRLDMLEQDVKALKNKSLLTLLKNIFKPKTGRR